MRRRGLADEKPASGKAFVQHDAPPRVFPVPRIARDWIGAELGLKPRLDRACAEVLDHPESAFSQALDQLFTQIVNTRPPHVSSGRSPLKILFVGEQDRAGTTTLAVNVAQLASKAGYKTLLIEANRAHPILASLLSPKVRVDLIELAGTKRVMCQLRPGLAMIPLFDARDEALHEARAAHCIKGISAHFDCVILDGGTYAPDEHASDAITHENEQRENEQDTPPAAHVMRDMQQIHDMKEMLAASDCILRLTSQGVEWMLMEDLTVGNSDRM